MSIIDFVISSTVDYMACMPKEQRKKYGQFFTDKETAVFMAGLFHIPSDRDVLTILDPGTGSGILSAALIERLQTIPALKKIRLVCYENDNRILPLLYSNLNWLKQNSSLELDYQVIPENYILHQKADYQLTLDASLHPQKFDMIIGNPPFMKIAKDAPEALAMPDICYGAPNLYFLFASMSMFNLEVNGELVYILPRSWTSGAYFRQFRQKFLNEGALLHIHLFDSRDKVFKTEEVLQETIIIKAKKTPIRPDTITVTTTQNSKDFSQLTVLYVPYTTVVSESSGFVYLPTNEDEVETLRRLNIMPDTLPSIGLKMKTGLTVDFRNREVLRSTAEEHTVPLFYAQHIQNGKVVFPVGRECEYITTEQNGLLQQNTNYLFVKRFTSKEEHRRLQCGIYLARKHPGYPKISTQNKINFICGLDALSECVVYGLYVLFNSTIYDRYYRILNGSTQVNSTEVNSMPVPAMSIIETMGKELILRKDLSEESCDSILRSYI